MMVQSTPLLPNAFSQALSAAERVMQQHMQHSAAAMTAAAARPAEPQGGAPPPPAADPGDVRMGRRLLEHLMVAPEGPARKAGGTEQMGFCAGEEQGRGVRA